MQVPPARNRRDIGGEAIEELGTSVVLQTSATQVISLSATLGCVVSSVPNSATLTLPAACSDNEKLSGGTTPDRLKAAFVAS